MVVILEGKWEKNEWNLNRRVERTKLYIMILTRGVANIVLIGRPGRLNGWLPYVLANEILSDFVPLL